MNVHRKMSATPTTVTTGPLPGSRKLYLEPACAPGMRVPVREILLDPSANEPNLRVYDSSGPYTESAPQINLAAGLPAIRESPGSPRARGSKPIRAARSKPRTMAMSPPRRWSSPARPSAPCAAASTALR